MDRVLVDVDLLADLSRRAYMLRARFGSVALSRQVGWSGRLLIVGRVVLLRGEDGHEAERREHLDVLLEERRRLLDALLDAVGDVERVAEAEVAAQLGLPSGAGARLTEGTDHLVAGATGRGASADEALDA